MPVACITKLLSRTDVGESHTHQSGILIPVADGRQIFPEPFGDPQGEWFNCEDHTGRVWRFKFQHRVKASESRITHTTSYIRQYLIRAGDTISICEPPSEGAPYTISFAPEDVVPWREGEEDIEVGEEGSAKRILVNRYERDPKNRQSAIKQHGIRCFGCRMEMAEVYGEIAKGYIHIHHVKPISAMQAARPNINDLVPLCPNCHAVVHLEKPPMPINKLKQLIQQHRGSPEGRLPQNSKSTQLGSSMSAFSRSPKPSV